ncbi:2-isopropylmalate synthase [Xenophilus azovorans]|uniref:2-isopropylmalate synthase n=1 Tax=Xenophilus azovorans TaxID=151755 RepID=UPI00056EDB26|nr:2-isopropylmalate synthase [Xenophilus azovorans]
MLSQPHTKYRPYPSVDLTDRTWPSRTLTQPPVWLSTDLRDGNQALFEPMSRQRKLKLFHELVRLGFKEIEVGFPAASKTDFDIVRTLVDEDLIPDDVTPMVMTQLREDLVRETVRSVRGARRAIVHLYNAIAPAWREIVFGLSVPQIIEMVEHHIGLLRRFTAEAPETQWVLQYSPETFCMAELEISLAVCNAAIAAWDAGPTRPMIINLPTTVEVTTPNVFADQVEWMHRRLHRREHIVLSVHPHNDRGTGVACAEQALLAGAQRVEGCLFGNGERSGNLDLVTLALNLYAQGVSPGLDFSDIAAVARIAEECTSLPIHPRHPYVGDLVFTAFSGSHQDAIAKGFAAQAADGPWRVPYLPIDPKDIGRTYDSIVRVNSQSGKGGIAYLLERDHGVVMPRRMQIEFSAIVQKHAEASETEISSEEIWRLFSEVYFDPLREGAYRYVAHALDEGPGGDTLRLQLDCTALGQRIESSGRGNGPIAATVAALNPALRVDSYEQRSLGSGADARSIAIVEVAHPSIAGSRFGVGVHDSIATASVLATLGAFNRLGVPLEKAGTSAPTTVTA